ncbi:MAG: N,N-dimethylformamidase beta subunit family domain-containing protein, partial [Verrucomicrobiia bacterium]
MNQTLYVRCIRIGLSCLSLWAAVAFFTMNLESAEPASARDLIRRENQKAGTSDWQLTYVRLDKSDTTGFRSPGIEGYCSRQSVAAGEPIEFFVSTDPACSFTLEIFRMGYYGGLGARLMKTLGPLTGKKQALPEVGPRRIRECRWEPSARLVIPADWPSGVYLGRLSRVPNPDGTMPWQSYVVFIV